MGQGGQGPPPLAGRPEETGTGQGCSL